jgi:hypothetical protein
MNLVSGFEETPQIFYVVTLSLVGLSAVLVGVGLRKLNSLRRVGLGGAMGKKRGIEQGRWLNVREFFKGENETVL